MRSPNPTEIKQARAAAALTQTQAAALIYKRLRTWQGWETPEGQPGHRKMDPAFWELFRLKITMSNERR
jgi:DNA-binding transcriptional regulator YiaG